MIAGPEIVTLEVRLSGWRGDAYEWYRAIEIPANATLHDLHCAIQDIVKFDDDHLYTFYTGRNWRQRENEIAEAPTPCDVNDYEQILLSDVYPLENKTKLYYWFDFGDDWIFEIVPRPGPKAPSRRVQYPRVIERRGRNPRQYR